MEMDKLTGFICYLDENGLSRYDAIATAFREKLKELEGLARDFTEEIKGYEDGVLGNKGETIAQSILAMRHIEDARMRFGKVIQYLGDGESNYKK